ncbi:MAG: universal stress protein [Calothrix sp. C42_A2020_038]|nr:universal stress protein [Calothrix sp. C42_A2020_038]
MMYKKILVAIDSSLQASKVFQEALDIAHQSGSHLMLFHCISTNLRYEFIPSVGSLADVDMYGTLQKQHQKSLNQETQKAQGWLETYCQKANISKVYAEYKFGYGEASKQICDFAKLWGADLIVLGRRGHRGITEILLGSVSSYVLHHASCSVLVVQ